WCTSQTVSGCPGIAPDAGMIPSSTCESFIAPPTVATIDCNDANSMADFFCGEYFRTASETFEVSGAEKVESFDTDCGPGWHVSNCDTVKSSTDGTVSIDHCPIGEQGGEVRVKLKANAGQTASGYGRSYCTADDTF
ncbi:MAG TPA: hypothetical protein VM686_12790, partial [Polyangiaceae bacterium]|nr:hypothetical protein [Polyangiaceae bacterium]